MREVILIGAPWCGACKMMQAWFDNLTLPGVELRYVDMGGLDDADYVILEGIASLPAVLFMENDYLVQTISGAMNRHDLEHAVQSLWPDMSFSSVAA